MSAYIRCCSCGCETVDVDNADACDCDFHNGKDAPWCNYHRKKPETPAPSPRKPTERRRRGC